MTAGTDPTWGLADLGRALAALALRQGLAAPGPALPVPPAVTATDAEAGVEAWIARAVDGLGIEAEASDLTYAELDRWLGDPEPAIVQLAGGPGRRFLVLLGSRGRGIRLLAPDLSVRRVDEPSVRSLLCGDLPEPLSRSIDRALGRLEVAPAARAVAAAVLLAESLGSRPVGRAWRLRLSPGAPVRRQLARARLPLLAAGFVGAHAAQYGLWILAWWIAGRAVLAGGPSAAWLAPWAAALLAAIPFRIAATWLQGRLALSGGRLLRRRLLLGALRLAPEEIRHQGAGQLLGRVIESEAVELLAVTGGLLALVAGVELLASLAVFWAAGSRLHAVLLAGCVGLTLILARGYLASLQSWTRARLDMTHDLVEAIVGHRTRLVQQPRARWHEGEAAALARYLTLSEDADRRLVRLAAVVPRGFLLLALVGLGLSLLGSRGLRAGEAAILGGALLAFQALRTLTDGLAHLGGAALAWQQVAQLSAAAGRAEPGGGADLDDPAGGEGAGTPLVDAESLTFRHPGRTTSVLDGVTLGIATGDRLLLSGSSGSGKSTLASLVAGLRVPDAGRLRLRGRELPEVGRERWRRQVVLSPQFHENHVLLGPLAFNLLMGRRWPPRPQDLEVAEATLRALGLGSVLDRMPAGLQQLLGETGWQLSHGEQSRLYVARALLQEARLVVLDESFGALDAVTLRGTLEHVLDRAPTLLVIVQ